MAISSISEAIDDIRSGKMIILVDDEDRENEGDLCMAAQFVTPEAINFMARHGRGLICLTINEELAGRLRLRPMVQGLLPRNPPRGRHRPRHARQGRPVRPPRRFRQLSVFS